MWRLTPAVKRDDADDFGIAEPGACALYAKLGASLSGRRVTRQNRTPDGMAIFFTSDTHFGHGGALGLYRRPFASVAAMNEAIIERWNEILGPDDEVWQLGDFLMWDNRCTIHARTDFPKGERRLLRRCTVEGGPLSE